MTTTIIDVRLTVNDGGSVTVAPVWAGVDRPASRSIRVSSKVAPRLKRAFLAGVVAVDAEVLTDNVGETYVSWTSKVSGRTANADLRRLGF